MESLTLTNRDDTLTTNLTDAQAAEACNRLPADHRSRTFAAGLVADLRRYGSLFPGKRFWLHRLALDQIERENPQANAAPPASGTLPRIAGFLTPVSDTLKSGARVTFVSGPLTVVIKRTGLTSRYPGHFHVVGTSGFGATEVYMGRIGDTGDWFPSRECGPEVFALLDEFESDPAEYAAAYGRRMGICCFCHAKLDDPVSMGLGYGPVCGPHYKLKHGKRHLAEMVAARVKRESEKAVEAVA